MLLAPWSVIQNTVNNLNAHECTWIKNIEVFHSTENLRVKEVHEVDQEFSTRGDCASQGVPGLVWKHLWLPWQGGVLLASSG